MEPTVMAPQEIKAFPEFARAKENQYLILRNRILTMWHDRKEKSKPLTLDRVVITPAGVPDKRADELRKIYHFLVEHNCINVVPEGRSSRNPKPKIEGLDELGS
jgi:hypothetical protein